MIRSSEEWIGMTIMRMSRIVTGVSKRLWGIDGWI